MHPWPSVFRDGFHVGIQRMHHGGFREEFSLRNTLQSIDFSEWAQVRSQHWYDSKPLG